jgi:hypothetical protein
VGDGSLWPRSITTKIINSLQQFCGFANYLMNTLKHEWDQIDVHWENQRLINIYRGYICKLTQHLKPPNHIFCTFPLLPIYDYSLDMWEVCDTS